MKRVILVAICWLYGAGLTLQAQQISVREGAEISYQAKQVVTEFEDLLNIVTNSDVGPKQIEDLIKNSYTESKNQIFYNGKVTIEDDTDPAASATQYKDAAVDKYLNRLDLYYDKSMEPSVTFSNVRTSGVKRKDYLYVRVAFDREFTNASKESDQSYQTVSRVADVRVDPVGQRWEARIIGISFQRPDDDLTDPANNVTLMAEAAESEEAVAEGLSQEEIDQRLQNLFRETLQEIEARGAAEKAEKDTEYAQAIQSGDAAYDAGDYDAARVAYQAATDIYGYKFHPKARLGEIDRIMEERGLYQEKIKEAQFARSVHNYDEAISSYQEALKLNPPDADAINRTIEELYGIVREISLPRNKLIAQKPEEAIKECNRLIKQHKADIQNFPEFFVIRGKAYVATDKSKQALKDYETAISYDPKYLDAYAARAALYADSRDFASAITDYDVITRIEGENPTHYAARAALKYRAGRTQDALEDYRRAQQLAPEDPNYYFAEGMILFNTGEFKQADDRFSEALRQDEGYAQAYFQRGIARIRQGKTKDAAADFALARANGLDEGTLAAVRTEGNQLYEQGKTAYNRQDYEQATAYLEDALVIAPEHSDAWFWLGQTHRRRGQAPAAARAFTEVISLKPDYAEGYYYRGLVYHGQQQHAKAVEDLIKAQALDKDDYRAYVTKGDALFALEDYRAAAQEYEMAASVLDRLRRDGKRRDELKRPLAEAYAKAGRAQAIMGKYEKALEHFEEAIDTDEGYAAAYYERGRALTAQGDAKKAVKDLDEALKMKYDEPAVRYARAAAYLQREEYDAALSDYTVVVQSSHAAEFPDARLRRAEVYRAQQRTKEAWQDVTDYRRKHPLKLNDQFYTTSGFVLLDMKQYDQALEAFEKALVERKNHGPALLGKGSAMAAKGQEASALQGLQQAFATRQLSADEVARAEERYLGKMTKNKSYKKLKKEYGF